MVTFARNRNLSVSAFRRAQLCPILNAFPEVINIDQTAVFNPGDDGQRLMAIAGHYGMDRPHFVQALRG
jgi:hypothetical protein